MKKNEERRHAAYGAIAAIVALIAVIGLTARQANGWDQFFNLRLQPSFLTVFLSFLGVVIIIIGFWRWNRPKKQRRAKYAYHSSLRH